MNEKLVIVPKKKTMVNRILNIVWFALACICLLLATLVSPLLFFIPALIFIGIWVYTAFYTNVEYEYTYFDGDLRFARIKNKAKRKRLAEVNMEDVIQIAPKGDRSVYKYENDNTMTYKNLASGEAGAKIYELICKGEKGMFRYEFEPDEDMLEAMMIKYARVIIK